MPDDNFEGDRVAAISESADLEQLVSSLKRQSHRPFALRSTSIDGVPDLARLLLVKAGRDPAWRRFVTINFAPELWAIGSADGRQTAGT